MRRTLHVACVLLFAAAPPWLHAAPPEVPPPVTAKPGELVLLKVKSPVGMKLGVTKSFDDVEAVFGQLVTEGDERQFVFQAKDDPALNKRDRFFAVTLCSDKESKGAMIVVRVPATQKAEPVPDVKPKPPPDVNPDPAPSPAKVDSLFIAVIEDATQPRTPELAEALEDPFWATLRPKHDWRQWRTTSPEAVQKKFVELSKGAGAYPALIVLDAKTRKSIYVMPFTTVADLKARVKEVTK